MINGSCLCQRCSYAADNKLSEVLHCHCTNCRKLHGAAFATYGGVSIQSFKWLRGESQLSVYHSSVDIARYFCRHCGCLLISIDNTEPNTVYLSLGGVGTDGGIQPQYHQFFASKVSWHEVDDNLPKFDKAFGD